MSAPLDLSKRVSQARFAALVGINQPRVSQLVAAGVLRAGGTLGEWLLAYCGSLRDQAAGRANGGGLDLSQERAALAREQRVKYELQNAVARGEFAPIALLADVLASASQGVVDRFATLPGRLRKARPGLSAEDHAAIGAALADASREWARATSAAEFAKRLKATV
jgi:phage terminase Nu1 subunit (DNA packaging protein)